ncbi:hypothetical protein [Geobacter sp. AOG2]|uniref:hypothetical protein n=1 Tax=Geobacter sp. AOG2 TaxID=1566347 RepID=UPI001CC5828A|nr:hypothetical protein [Geobacter sp. AOG2]GFE60345.1 hypothetical protein AOG2_09330 [Geobacter sp. AOG2]
MQQKNILIVLMAMLALQLMAPKNSHAIPAFTRAYKVECSTCHTIYPELNEYGEAFLKNAYVYFGKGQKAAKAKGALPLPVLKATAKPTGGTMDVKGEGDADKLSKLKAGAMGSSDTTTPESAQEVAAPAAVPGGEAKPEGLLLAAIPELLPISFTASIHATYDHSAVNELDLSTRVLKLNAGGNFREKAAFFATYVAYSENTSNITSTTSTTPANNSTNINELFFIWRHALGTPINFKVGRMQPKLGLWKSNNKLSTTNSFAPYAYTVGVSEFRTEQPQDALEANAVFANRFFIAGGVVNRKDQNTKEGYGHISYKFGGADYLANEPEVDLDKEESILDFLTVTLGAYGYYGKNGTPNTTAGVPPIQNSYYRTGMDLDILYKLFRLRMAGVLGRDDNAYLSNTPTEVKSYVAAIEGEYTFLQNLIGAMRFEYQDDGRGLVRRFIPTLAYAPLENLKVALEYKHELATAYKATEGSSAQDFTNKIGTLGVTFSF